MMTGGLGNSTTQTSLVNATASNPVKERTFEEKLTLLNGLTVTKWCNVQDGQPLLIITEDIHAEQAQQIAQLARTLRKSAVQIHTFDREKDLARINSSESLDDLKQPDSALQSASNWIVESKGALIRIVGDKNPAIFDNVDQERIQALKGSESIAMDALTKEVMAGRMNRCVIASATEGWAQDLGISRELLQEEIFQMCSLNAQNPDDAFKIEDDILEKQRARLQAFHLTELTFSGDSLNLTVGLSPDAIWLGGKKFTTDDRNLEFYANVPIGEIFTSPDWTKTTGIVKTSQPLYINGTLIDGATFVFKDGEVIDFKADKGSEALQAFFDADPAHRRLGEIALVSLDCASAKITRVAKTVLLDEKKKCHFAFGRCYPVCIVDGGNRTEEDQQRLGMNVGNKGTQHIDLMFSNENTSVWGKTGGGEKIVLMEHGVWVCDDQ